MIADTVQVMRRVGDDDSRAIAFTIIGVAKDVVSGFVYQGTDTSHIYLPTSATGSRAQALLVRRAAGTSMDSLKAALQGVHNDLLGFDVLPVDEMVALQMFPLRAASWIGALLSAIALALSVSGLYGVLTYTFGQRTREIGIRIALGASARAISRLVFDYSLRLGGVGTPDRPGCRVRRHEGAEYVRQAGQRLRARSCRLRSQCRRDRDGPGDGLCRPGATRRTYQPVRDASRRRVTRER